MNEFDLGSQDTWSSYTDVDTDLSGFIVSDDEIEENHRLVAPSSENESEDEDETWAGSPKENDWKTDSSEEETIPRTAKRVRFAKETEEIILQEPDAGSGA